MSRIMIKNSVVRPGHGEKKVIQACEIGGSIYGRTLPGGRSHGKQAPERRNDLAAQYKNFYRHQVDIMSKVFEKNAKRG